MAEYFEKDNVIYRARRVPGFSAPDVEYMIVDGQWKPCSSKDGRDAYTWGNPMDEAEAKEFQGEGWPTAEPAA